MRLADTAMNLADIATWLTDLTPDSPCGEDEEYSADFRALEQAIAGKPDAQYGGTVIAATPPDWTLAHALATALLARTRDLRVAVHYTRASMVREDFIGLARGLALIEGLLARHWSGVHPQLDASDGDDPTARVNALSALIDGSGLVGELRDTPFVAPRGQRGFTLRDMEVLAGEAPLFEGDEMPTLAAIDAAFAQAGAEAGRAQCEALSSARASLTQIETLLTEHVGRRARSTSGRSRVRSGASRSSWRRGSERPIRIRGEGAVRWRPIAVKRARVAQRRRMPPSADPPRPGVSRARRT
jgi:type VI secretion system protein ImpA